MFMIKGGVHTDTTFTAIEPGTEESYGPFGSYEQAVLVWRGAMGRNIDICEHRLFIVREDVAAGKFRGLDFVTIIDGPCYVGEKARVMEALSGKQYAVKVLTGPEAHLRGTYITRESNLKADPNPQMSACDKCGAEYPSAPIGVIHKCGRCSGGMCHRKEVA